MSGIRRFGIGILCAIGGYVLDALVGDFLISTFSLVFVRRKPRTS